MTEEERREMTRSNFAMQMAGLGYDPSGNPMSPKEPKPRLMTKEEIIGWDGYIWFEFKGMKAMKAVLIDHGMVREPFRGDYPTKELSWGTYQETWRAWKTMPTDEQRQAVKWND